jgi:hypothetical protein
MFRGIDSIPQLLDGSHIPSECGEYERTFCVDVPHIQTECEKH